MNAPETEAVGNQITRLTRMSVSSLQDTLWSRSHSRDFAFARGDYLRNRVLVVGGIFIGLLPLWTLIDWLVLPAQSIHAALTARVVMLIVLLLTLFIAYKSKARPANNWWTCSAPTTARGPPKRSESPRRAPSNGVRPPSGCRRTRTTPPGGCA